MDFSFAELSFSLGSSSSDYNWNLIVIKGLVIGVSVLIFGLFSEAIRSLYNWCKKNTPKAKRLREEEKKALEEAKLKAEELRLNEEFFQNKEDEEFWAIASSETETNRNKGLWAKCLFMHKDDFENARNDYLRLRVEQLKNEEMKKASDRKRKLRIRWSLYLCFIVLGLVVFWSFFAPSPLS